MLVQYPEFNNVMLVAMFRSPLLGWNLVMHLYCAFTGNLVMRDAFLIFLHYLVFFLKVSPNI